jgi:hypothetical protein
MSTIGNRYIGQRILSRGVPELNWSKIKKVILGLVSATAMLNFSSVTPAQSTSLESAPHASFTASAASVSPASSANMEGQPYFHLLKRMADATPRPEPVPYIKLGTKGLNATWMNEALATLHYLPVQFIPESGVDSATSPVSTSSGKPIKKSATLITATTASTTNTSNPGNSEVNPNSAKPDTAGNTQKVDPEPLYITLSGQLKLGNLQPLSGKWVWDGNYPTSLVKLWDPNTFSTITQGALMRFESDNKLTADGIAGPLVDKALVEALAKNKPSAHPYVYVSVTKSGSQHLDVWQNGKKTLTVPANTGIEESPTPNGTWPIYLRMKSQTMKGTLPDGGTYNDPGVPFVNYFYQGCAIHGFVRSSYGSPQSLGCVELPVHTAQQLFSVLGYGTLVTVHA